MVSAERLRLDEADGGGVPWRRWGPYLSERQWGKVREDYGSGDDAWSYFTHDQARHMVVVNFSEQPAQARIPLDWPDLPGRSWRFTDILSQSAFERDGAELAGPGLFVDLGPWQFHLLALR